jgi:hypothetical protein
MAKFVKLGKDPRQAVNAWLNIDSIVYIDQENGVVVHPPFHSYATQEEILKIIKLANMPDTRELPAEQPNVADVDFTAMLMDRLKKREGGNK